MSDSGVGILITIVEKFLGQLLVTMPGVDRKKQRILLGEDGSERGLRGGIEIRLVRFRNSIGSVQRAQHFLSAGLESRVVLPLALDEDLDFIGIGIGDVAEDRKSVV